MGIDFILDEKLKERVVKIGKYEADFENGKDNLDPDKKIENTGNFKGLLKLCSDLGDITLTEHLTTCAKSASYISKTSQNELLVCIK